LAFSKKQIPAHVRDDIKQLKISVSARSEIAGKLAANNSFPIGFEI
jgi:hypothetical protein